MDKPASLHRKDPVLALLLSLFPGGGQIYNGHLGKALLVILTYPWSVLFGPALYDAYRSARRHNERLDELERRVPPQLGSGDPSSAPVAAYRNLHPSRRGAGEGPGALSAALLAVLGGMLMVSAAVAGSTLFLALLAGLTLAGLALSQSSTRELQRARERAFDQSRSAMEAAVFRLASRNGGRLTLGQVVDSTQLGLVESEGFMESLALAGHVEYVVEEDGRLSYLFPDLLRVPDSGVEREVLRFARQSGGRIQLGQLALACERPLRDLQACLDQLCAEGVARRAEEGGRTSYLFSDFLPH